MSYTLRTFCITLPEYPDRRDTAKKHFNERGVQAQFFDGIHAEKFGVNTTLPYENDHPGSGFSMGFKPTGIWLSHWCLWSALNLSWDSHFLILEDDCRFPEDWHVRFSNALRDTPDGWDMLYIGSCCCGDKPKEQIKNEVWSVRWPFCTHAYCVAKKALPTLLQTQREARVYAPIDCSLIFHTFEKLKVYTVLPRICDQWDTIIAD